MAENSVKDAGKLNLNVSSKRQEYLDLIDHLLETCHSKAQSKYCKNSERIAWIRAATGLIGAGVAVLKDEEIELRVLELEKKLKEGVLIERNN
jgi:hypothetical protein